VGQAMKERSPANGGDAASYLILPDLINVSQGHLSCPPLFPFFLRFLLPLPCAALLPCLPCSPFFSNRYIVHSHFAPRVVAACCFRPTCAKSGFVSLPPRVHGRRAIVDVPRRMAISTLHTLETNPYCRLASHRRRQ
jgi:hypothetical protein